MEQSPAEIELAKIKAQNKARQAKYLEKRRAEGKRHLSAMVSGETYNKLCRLRDQSITAGKTKNLGEVLDKLLNDENTATGQGQGSQPREKPIKAIADQIVQENEDHRRENPSTIETQNNLFDESAPDERPDLSDKATIIKAMAEYRAAGDTWPTVAEKLNNQGIVTARGETWTKANAQAFYSRNK